MTVTHLAPRVFLPFSFGAEAEAQLAFPQEGHSTVSREGEVQVQVSWLLAEEDANHSTVSGKGQSTSTAQNAHCNPVIKILPFSFKWEA